MRSYSFLFLIVVLVILSSVTLAMAQSSQYQAIKGVKFRDGTVIMGTVTQLNVETVTIRLDNGQIVVRKFDDVETFIKRDDAVKTYQETTPAAPPAAVVAPAAVPAAVPPAAPTTTAPAAAPAAVPPAAAPAASPAAASPTAAPAAVPPTVVESTKTDAIETKQETKPYDASATSARIYDTRYSSLEFGIMYYYYDYKEVNEPPPFKSTESGWLPGLYLGYEYKKPSDVYTKIYGHIAGGDLTYDGTTFSGIPKSFDHSMFFFKFEGDIGYTVPIDNRFLIIPYTGYGYRYWRRGETEVIEGAPFIKEVYTWSYIPVGIKFDYAINDKWNIGASTAVHFMFGGEMKLYASEFNSSFPDVTFDLGNKPGFYLELPIRYKLANNWSILGSFWYEYSEIGKSDVIYGLLEPDSETHQYGFNLGVSYLF